MSNTEQLRTIHIQAKNTDLEDKVRRIEAYLYSNFEIATTGENPAPDNDFSTIVINGYDRSGWTAESQNDRLWSGMLGGVVIQ